MYLCTSFDTTFNNAISKVSRSYFDNYDSSFSAPMSLVKGVLIGEKAIYDSEVSFYRYIPSLDFLYDSPDISIEYNMNKSGEVSFSLEPSPYDQYDFVSVVLRDLLIGFGLTSNFRVNPIAGVLHNPARPLLPFETIITEALGEDATTAYIRATQGELRLDSMYNVPTLKLCP